MSTDTASLTSTGWIAKARRFAPLALIGAAIAAAFSFGVGDYLTFEALRENRHVLMMFVHDQGLLAVATFVGIYIVVTALSLPGGAILSVAGGFLFGSVLGTAYIVLGATLGAVGIFGAAQTALGNSLKAKAGPWLKKMEAGFQENALSYLLVLRLVPLFPFFVVNLVPAFLGVRLKIFTIGTAIGIVPGAFVFASVGAGLGSVFDSNATFTPASALTPEVIVALVGLSLLSLLPLAYKKLRIHCQREEGK
ncbi:MAG: TVP38/TMEM64 family protein [Alphaproteobacteria bacterium]|nr:TVP38/TMEM64 family protein [Alphaproteobacteria bacterium]